VGFELVWRRERDCLRFAQTSCGLYKKSNAGLRPFSFFIAVALESKLSKLHQQKMPHKGAFDFLAEREGFEPPDL
jgi:hypothetical protein